MPREVKWAISLLVGAGLLALGWKVYFVLVTLHVIICGLLIIVIMLQSGEAFGPRGAATFLSKATTWCAIMFMMTSMALTMHQNSAVASTGSSVLQQFSKTSKAPAAPVVPVPAAPASAPAPSK